MTKILGNLWLWTAILASILASESIVLTEKYPTKAEIRSRTVVPNEALPADLAQLTSVSQLSDVQPTDWAFQALQSLVERYGCIAGYPDSPYRGNHAMTSYKFVVGLNACLDRINELIASATTNLVTHEMDFAKEVSDRILFLDQGKLAEDATPQKFFHNPQCDRAKLFLEKML